MSMNSILKDTKQCVLEGIKNLLDPAELVDNFTSVAKEVWLWTVFSYNSMNVTPIFELKTWNIEFFQLLKEDKTEDEYKRLVEQNKKVVWIIYKYDYNDYSWATATNSETEMKVNLIFSLLEVSQQEKMKYWFPSISSKKAKAKEEIAEEKVEKKETKRPAREEEESSTDDLIDSDILKKILDFDNLPEEQKLRLEKKYKNTTTWEWTESYKVKRFWLKEAAFKRMVSLLEDKEFTKRELKPLIKRLFPDKWNEKYADVGVLIREWFEEVYDEDYDEFMTAKQ